MQQNILWAEVLKETKRWKSRWTVRDLLADGRCGQAVLDFLSSTDVGRLVPPLEEADAGSEVSEWELRERREREEEAEELGAAGELGAGGSHRCSCPHPLHAFCGRGVGFGDGFLCSPLCLSFVISLVCFQKFSGTGLGGGQKGSLQRAATARTADGKPG